MNLQLHVYLSLKWFDVRMFSLQKGLKFILARTIEIADSWIFRHFDELMFSNEIWYTFKVFCQYNLQGKTSNSEIDYLNFVLADDINDQFHTIPTCSCSFGPFSAPRLNQPKVVSLVAVLSSKQSEYN